MKNGRYIAGSQVIYNDTLCYVKSITRNKYNEVQFYHIVVYGDESTTYTAEEYKLRPAKSNVFLDFLKEKGFNL